MSKKENTCYVTEKCVCTGEMTGTASAGVVSAEMGKTNAEGDQTLGEQREEAVGKYCKSPLVGTFYSAPAEDAESFVKVGDRVEKRTDTCGIVEAMKLMNEIESDFDGTVAEILVNNQEGVEYGQPLFRIA